MEQKNLARWLKSMIIGVGVCGLIIYVYLVPVMGKEILKSSMENVNNFTPWLIFIWLTGIPCYVVLVLAWQIAENIGKDRSFSDSNANKLKLISYFAAGDSIFFFIVNIIFLILDINKISIVLLSLFIVFAGIVVAVAAAVLSHLVKKAADLQEQSDFTI